MEVPCVRVDREDGERVRQTLADDGLLADEFEITAADGMVYLPVADPDGASSKYEVVVRDVPARETPTTPADLLSFDPSYARVGDVAVLDEDDPERARAIADAIVDSDLPIERVLNRASKVHGTHRVRDWEVLAGEGTETVHREYGCAFELDLSTAYFSPRLATERHRVAEQVTAGERVVDMFAGVGPFAVPFARRGAEVVAVDINEHAVEYLRRNIDRNGVADDVLAVHGDVRDLPAEYRGWADRLVMNLPHSADEFLDTAVELAGEECLVHYYDIQHEDDPFGPGTETIRAAAEPDYDVTVETEHVVRSYAPHELNVCLDVRLTRRE